MSSDNGGRSSAMTLESNGRRMQLAYIDVVGLNVEPAVIDFGTHLTVIHGASDTGKSHVFELLEYAFGLRQKIDMPPEGDGYQYVLLGLTTAGEGDITLVRDLTGGKVGLYPGHLRSLPVDPAPEYLKPNHTSSDSRSVSRFLLGELGLDELFVRRNQNNVLRMLEFRDVFRLAAVDEQKIIAKRSPIEFGQHQDRPVESAVFRLLIQGEDDSGLVEIPKVAALKEAATNKVAVVDQLIDRVETQLAGSPERLDLQDQDARLSRTILGATNALEEVSAGRDALVAERSAVSRQVDKFTARLGEISSLHARFTLLKDQYESDLKRLELLHQAGDVFKPRDGSSCPFCGADSHHQDWGNDRLISSGDLQSATDAEAAKINVLRGDLMTALTEMVQEGESLATSIDELAGRRQQLSLDIARVDREITSPAKDLQEAVRLQAGVRKQLDLMEQLAELLALRDDLANFEKPKTDAKVPISSTDLLQFDAVASDVLRAWTFSTTDPEVRYSTEDRDLEVGRRSRTGRGKGVRSILHALFNVSLAEYCAVRNIPHPGFVVLDSPVVSYRHPGESAPTGEDETVLLSVVDAFYAYLQGHFTGQAIVLENKSPVSPLPPGATEYFFRGAGQSGGREGFYPSRP